MSEKALCFATNNIHKLEEVRQILVSDFLILSLEDIHCKDELPENQATLEGNSLEKANYIFNHFNIPCFADDTGLEVNALNGAPGVYSARYAGAQRKSEDNVNLLLENLKGEKNRTAQFRTVITFVDKDLVKSFEGIITGTITDHARGIKGFGYDPVFQPDGHAETFAEMSLEQKNKLSHRAKAIQKLAYYLMENFR